MRKLGFREGKRLASDHTAVIWSFQSPEETNLNKGDFRGHLLVLGNRSLQGPSVLSAQDLIISSWLPWWLRW